MKQEKHLNIKNFSLNSYKTLDTILAEMLLFVDCSNFMQKSLKILSHFIACDGALVCLYKNHQQNAVMYEKFNLTLDQDLMLQNAQFSYSLNPFFQSKHAKIASDVYSLDYQIKPKDLQKENIYISQIEINMCITENDSVQIALYRLNQHKFSKKHLDLLSNLHRRIACIYYQYFKKSPYNDDNINKMKAIIAKKANPKLSKQELTCLALCTFGHENKDIAKKLNISQQSVKTYMERGYLKLAIRNKTQLQQKIIDDFI